MARACRTAMPIESDVGYFTVTVTIALWDAAYVVSPLNASMYCTREGADAGVTVNATAPLVPVVWEPTTLQSLVPNLRGSSTTVFPASVLPLDRRTPLMVSFDFGAMSVCAARIDSVVDAFAAKASVAAPATPMVRHWTAWAAGHVSSAK